MNVQIEPTWKQYLQPEFETPYFKQLTDAVRQEYKNGPCYPPGHLIFNAFNLTPFDKVKVVIIGQDPYHEPGQAMGLSFSVPEGVMMPPSLVNIFKEIHDDLGKPMPTNGDLTRWAKQGVLLLNATLTACPYGEQHQRLGGVSSPMQLSRRCRLTASISSICCGAVMHAASVGSLMPPRTSSLSRCIPRRSLLTAEDGSASISSRAAMLI